MGDEYEGGEGRKGRFKLTNVIIDSKDAPTTPPYVQEIGAVPPQLPAHFPGATVHRVHFEPDL